MTAVTTPLELSVLTAPIAAIDRRILSQAWYSALGFAQNAEEAGLAAPPRRRSQAAAAEPRDKCPPTRSVPPSLAPLRSSRRVRSKLGNAHPCASRAPHTVVGHSSRGPAAARRDPNSADLGERIARKLVVGLHGHTRTTIKLDGDRGRVHVMLQTHRGRMRIIAICPKRFRGRVAQAIDEARNALASQGIHIDTNGGSVTCK
jgi:hypothetical protein